MRFDFEQAKLLLFYLLSEDFGNESLKDLRIAISFRSRVELVEDPAAYWQINQYELDAELARHGIVEPEEIEEIFKRVASNFSLQDLDCLLVEHTHVLKPE